MFLLTRSGGNNLPRRIFLQASLMLTATLALRSSSRAAEFRERQPLSFGRAKRCIFVFLNGGPSQLDTWDMKPDAPLNVRGELKPISTSVAGIQAGELLPQMARLAHRF